MEYSQLKECLLQSVQCIMEDEENITVEHLEFLQKRVLSDRYGEGLLSGLFVGYSTAQGLRSEFENNDKNMNDQFNELIEYVKEFKTK